MSKIVEFLIASAAQILGVFLAIGIVRFIYKFTKKEEE